MFHGHSMYGWIVTVARPRIDGVGPNFAVFGRRTLQVRTCKTKVQAGQLATPVLKYSGVVVSSGVLMGWTATSCFLW